MFLSAPRSDPAGGYSFSALIGKPSWVRVPVSAALPGPLPDRAVGPFLIVVSMASLRILGSVGKVEEPVAFRQSALGRAMNASM